MCFIPFDLRRFCFLLIRHAPGAGSRFRPWACRIGPATSGGPDQPPGGRALRIIKMEAERCECVKTSEFVPRPYLKKMFEARGLVCVRARVRALSQTVSFPKAISPLLL